MNLITTCLIEMFRTLTIYRKRKKYALDGTLLRVWTVQSAKKTRQKNVKIHANKMGFWHLTRLSTKFWHFACFFVEVSDTLHAFPQRFRHSTRLLSTQTWHFPLLLIAWRHSCPRDFLLCATGVSRESLAKFLRVHATCGLRTRCQYCTKLP